MLNRTKKIKKLYEDIRKKLYNMIPEKWESMIYIIYYRIR